MRLGKSTIRSYRKAANQMRHKASTEFLSDPVVKCLDLVEQLSLVEVPAFDGLVMPLMRGQPGHLLELLEAKTNLDLIIPVCSPPPINARNYKPAITPEAAAGIRAANVLAGVFAEAVTIDVRPLLLVADTETDIEPVMQRAGGQEHYLEIASESAGLITYELNAGSRVDTFSNYFNERVVQTGGFHYLQYAAECAVRQAMSSDTSLYMTMNEISKQRNEKHKLILGRPERDHELAIRYAAQYSALGDYVRESVEVDAVCNYPTPNANFYNDPSKTAVAVFESRIKR